MMMKRLLFFIFLTGGPLFSFTQNLTGIWRGYFITDNLLQYSYEVQMEQKGANSLSGVTYSYLGKSFYGKTSMTGTFNKATGQTILREIKTLEVRMSAGSVACIQKCVLSYIQSGREEFLEGTFTSVFEKSDSANGYIRGNDCGGGRMYLRKVTTSDFYIEPFLRNKLSPHSQIPAITKTDPVKPSVTPKNKPTSPETKTTSSPNNTNRPDLITQKAPAKQSPVVQKKTSQSPAINKSPVAKPKIDSAIKMESANLKAETRNEATVKPSVKIPAILTQRQNDLMRTLIINTEQVIVKLYDNGEIDDDTISVYLDNQLILSKQRLTTSPLTINLKMDESHPEHELVMVAENLGRIPPNTSLMVVQAGDNRYEVRITSTEQKNAVVRFRYVKP